MAARHHQSPTRQMNENLPNQPVETVDELLANRVDVIITSSLERRVDDLLLDRASRMHIPLLPNQLPGRQASVVAVRYTKAGIELGKWVVSNSAPDLIDSFMCLI
jgi:DNA-binding LacI/PurR family transcriptional regulator